ncbi:MULTISPECIES: NTP transferase domain-containing protein [Bacillota]|jgi:choline kinase|uniref:Phosphocholine cytidylyltransferase family protein n=2 Tax=Amedibacillus TaxID=2749846 RepID=A0A7G9GJT5_9FIRM|nr:MULTISPECIES: phosphocholine cytidylyltransferase family protein [Bacillota]QNM11067.1 phosphocholine cytidylyltransferase family protein [[Eubacterium] hominis]MCH4286498.1 phosphocholine cytidylyltransferase family protein [Amedibacillus hominis]RGB58615.1 phosphocholine cytidylyltransferase family protein [Absiella sp. AM22-9]RGB63445.1 phosphocholine cytidylyltransferase family protein [Absiella sp. AM10-20]RGB66209.1 phosphocholine cytidylyltransferase family protein [Absiella sp. AM09
MKAILMAAGMGTRISTKTNEPKSLLNIGNGPLIKHTVELLLKNHIDVVICLGFKGYLIKEALKDYPVTFYENPFYKVTNSIASLWFAREELLKGEDLILANADVFWQQDILDILIQETRDVVLLADSSRKLSGDYFFRCENECLQAYGKELHEDERDSEYVGLAKVRKELLPVVNERLKKLVHDGDYQLWWENTLYSMICERDIYVQDIAGHYWSEIDVLQDYESILSYVKKHPLDI